MATEVYTTEEITLLDGSDVVLQPLPIAKMRKFSRIWSEHMRDISNKFNELKDSDDDDVINDADLTDQQYDAFIKMCALGLERSLKDTMTDKQFSAYLEDVLDEKTIYKILYVTGGLKLDGEEDPNQNPPVNPAGAGTV